ncbi:MAG: dihydropteridine reductase [Clostridia bacterium]|nr:dihydropteridine reductase [Clostridia bacterium]
MEPYNNYNPHDPHTPNNRFEYTYAAPTKDERKEVEDIRKYYGGSETEDKLTRLRKLDDKAKMPPMLWSLSLGIIGTLIFGGGMSMVMLLAEWYFILCGVLLALVGLGPIALAYPMYKKVSKKCKDKYGEEILRLSEEILNEMKE